MKHLITLTIVFALFAAQAQPSFKQALGQALTQYGQAKTIEDLTASANQFKRISQVETKEWLPLYYNAQAYIRMSFMLNDNNEQRDAYLDAAQKSVDEMLAINNKESEIYALQSLLYTARLVIDPMNRGQQMMMKSGQAIGQALGLNPNNPRAQYLLLSNEVGQAQFFGKEVEEFCPRINTLYANWDELNQVPELYPSWGKDEVAGLKNLCK